ncbi:hypothetical protein HHI36_013459 [Cryptolaemus montrouzieri]|uniref:Uncharacterized protein n=1 Tax=Cryptolaemus montrouzieri TaxID=559131 RepID=A0ABD2NHW6_9CUCU
MLSIQFWKLFTPFTNSVKDKAKSLKCQTEMSYEEVYSCLQRLWDENAEDRDTDDEEDKDEQDIKEERESSDTDQQFHEYG